MLILLTFVVMYCSTATAEAENFHGYEQSHFSAEDNAAKKPVPIPNDVLAVLRKDESVRDVLDYEKVPAEQMPLAWFSASAIHLSRPERVDLVVMGQGPLRGANVITFWVFVTTPHGYELVLSAPAHDLFVKKTRSKGHRDIVLTSMTARQIVSELCRFDGKRYAKYRATSKPIR